MPIFIPDLFTGYVTGRRNAIKDNWEDVMNFNEGLQGQLQNAMSMETFDDAARMAHNASAVSDLKRLSSSVDTALGLQKYQLGQDAGLPQREIQAQVAYCDAMIKQWEEKKAEILSGQNTGAKVAGMDDGTQTTTQPQAQVKVNQPTVNSNVDPRNNGSPTSGSVYNQD